MTSTRGKRFFIDVGVWAEYEDGLAHTDFGLVSGKCILLCSWLNMENHSYIKTKKFSAAPKNNKFKTKFTPALNSFYKILLKDRKLQRVFINKYLISTEPLTPEKDILLFLPDLHLHLLKGTKYDDFVYLKSKAINLKKGDQNSKSNNKNNNTKEPLTSLEEEFAALLDIIKAVNKNYNTKAIQVGDLFEIWESQAHLIHRHMWLSKLLKEQYNTIDVEFSSGYLHNRNLYNGNKLREPLQKMLDSKTIIPFTNLKNITTKECKSYYLCITNDHVKNMGVPILDMATIKNRIIKIFKEIFKAGKIPDNLICLRGNHDNMIDNSYYCKKDDNSAYIINGTSPKLDEIEYHGGINNCILAEHGHKKDKYNRDEKFWKPPRLLRKAGGYHYTRSFTLGNIVGKGGYKRGKYVRSIGSAFYDMRDPQLERAIEIFNNDSGKYDNIRLLVMGHSHSAELLDYDLLMEKKERMSEYQYLGKV